MLFSQVKLLFIYRTNGKLLRGDQVCRMQWQGFLSHHKWKWFTVIPHLEDPLCCGCPNPSIPTQCILACVVAATHAYTQTLFKQSLNNHNQRWRKILFSSQDEFVLTFLLFTAEAFCSNAVIWNQISKELQLSSWVEKTDFFQRRGIL